MDDSNAAFLPLGDDHDVELVFHEDLQQQPQPEQQPQAPVIIVADEEDASASSASDDDDDDDDDDGERRRSVELVYENPADDYKGAGFDSDDVKGSSSSSSNNESNNKIALYQSRWLMLLLFSFVSLTNSCTWICCASIADMASEYYDVTPMAINMLSMVFMLVFAAGVVLGSYVMMRRGLRYTVCLGAVLNVAGTLIRVLPAPFASAREHPHASFLLVFTGQTVCSVAQLFVLAVPVTLAEQWFASSERVLAVAIGSSFNQLGVCVGFWLSPLIAGAHDSDPEHARMTLLLVLHAVLAVCTALPVLACFRDRPPRPPSAAALAVQQHRAHQRHTVRPLQVLRAMYELLAGSKSFLLLVLVFGLTIGAAYAVTTILDELIGAFGYTSRNAGNFGSLFVLTGLVAALLFGYLGDKTHAYKALIAASLFATVLAMLWFVFSSRVRNNDIVLALCFGTLGFAVTANLPLFLDVSAELSYPNVEVGANVMLGFGNLGGVVLITLCGELAAVSQLGATIVITLTFASALVLWLCFHPVYRRLEAERQRHLLPAGAADATGTRAPAPTELQVLS
jgi:FLVCR family feline leukemia virus subgroup C receptor-related protein